MSVKTGRQHRTTQSARYQKLKILYRISDLINTTSNPSTLLRRILREAVREMKATCGTIAFVDSEGKVLEIVAAQGVDPKSARELKLSLGQGVTGHVAKSGKPLRIEDVSQSPHYVELKRGVRSELAVPLKVEGQVIGIINVDSAKPGAFTQEDERLLMALANQAAKVIHTSRLHERLHEQSRRLEALFEVGQALISPDPLPEVLNRITSTVQALMGVKLCSIMLLSNNRELTLSAVTGGSQRYAQRPALPVAESLVGEVVTRRQPLQVYDVKKAQRYRAATLAREEKLSSLLSVPVFFHEALIGILNIYTEQPRRFSEEEMRLLNAFASLSGIAIENAQRYEAVLRAEQSIRQADRLATLGTISAELAHEIRNPVTIIKMLLHSLREENAIASSRERDVVIISDKIERIERVVSQVLGFARRHRTRVEWIDLNTVLRDLMYLMRHAATARQVILREMLQSDLPLVLGDRGHYEQIFLNLIQNALEAMPGGGMLVVRTSVRYSDEPEGEESAEDESEAQSSTPSSDQAAFNTPSETGRPPGSPAAVVVSIRDSGVGIPPELMEQLFTPFVSSRQEGVGLGLFVSQKLLLQNGGTIRVRSTPGRGTTFTVTIPVEAEGK